MGIQHLLGRWDLPEHYKLRCIFAVTALRWHLVVMGGR
jgi:hypothetical protein